MHNIQLANEKDRWAGASSCVLLYVYSHMTMNEHDTYTMMQRDHQNNCFMNMQDHDPHIRKRQYCCITKRKPSSAWIWVNQASCSSAGRGKTFLQTGTVTDKILGLCRSHLHLEHLVRCSCEHTSFEQHHGHDFEQFPSSLQIKYTMQSRWKQFKIMSVMFCMLDHCQRTTCYTSFGLQPLLKRTS